MRSLARIFGVIWAEFFTHLLSLSARQVAFTKRCPDVCRSDSLFSLLRQNYYRERLWFSSYQAIFSTLLSLALALPAALLLSYFDLRQASLAKFIKPSLCYAEHLGCHCFLSLVGPQGFLGIDLRNSLGIILWYPCFL
ncbi:MAG: hypothetical protein R2865_08690 [Deinococcales bacterium]